MNYKNCLVGILLSIFLIVFSYTLYESTSNKEEAKIRRRRQYVEQRERRTTPSDEYIKRELEDFWPALSDRCPDKYMMCKDESYCFKTENMCGGADICLDSSDDINAHCLGKTRPVSTTSVTATMMTRATSENPTVSDIPTQTQPSVVQSEVSEPLKFDQFNSFRHPLVIAFFSLIGLLLVYVTIATICCVTLKWNRINPSTPSQ